MKKLIIRIITVFSFVLCIGFSIPSLVDSIPIEKNPVPILLADTEAIIETADTYDDCASLAQIYNEVNSENHKNNTPNKYNTLAGFIFLISFFFYVCIFSNHSDDDSHKNNNF